MFDGKALDKKLGISADRRKWLNDREAKKNNHEKVSPVAVVHAADDERDRARIWARKYIRREDIFQSSAVESGYRTELQRLIQEYGFTSCDLGVEQPLYNRVRFFVV